jgi:hypothetical protein
MIKLRTIRRAERVSHGREYKSIHGFDRTARPLGELAVVERITFKYILRKEDREGVDWIHLAHDRAQRWALVNTVMNLGVP